MKIAPVTQKTSNGIRWIGLNQSSSFVHINKFVPMVTTTQGQANSATKAGVYIPELNTFFVLEPGTDLNQMVQSLGSVSTATLAQIQSIAAQLNNSAQQGGSA